MKKRWFLSICFVALAIITLSFAERLNAKSEISTNIEALLVPDLNPGIPCSGGCVGTYPEVYFCVLCGTCKMHMWFKGFGYTGECDGLQ